MSVTLLALARFTLKGPYRASAVVGLLAVLAVILPPLLGFGFLSMVIVICFTITASILVGLIILTQGSASGLKVIFASVLGVVIVTWIVLKSPAQGISIALVYWLPIVVLAQSLRSGKSLALMLLSGVALGILAILAQLLFWNELQGGWIFELKQQAENVERLDQGSVEKIAQTIGVLMLVAVPSLYLLCTLAILAARWAQMRLADGAGFGREFQALQLGRSSAKIALILMAICFWIREPWTLSLAFLLIVTFMYQGVAVVHAKLVKKKQPVGVFALFYLILILFSQIVVILTSIIGIIDNWLDFRAVKVNPTDSNQN